MIKLALDVDETDAEHPAILEQFLNIYRENIASESTLFDGIEDVLISLENNNVQWGIVTNKSAWLTEPLIKALDLEHRASCVVSGDTTEHRKPHPASILHACELTQSDPATTVYIGDALRDIEAGRRAGTKTLIALYGYIDADEDPASWGADGMVSTPLEIKDILREFCN